jgi:hypothetical protein
MRRSLLTLVTKVDYMGRPCPKCAAVLRMLAQDGLRERVDRHFVLPHDPEAAKLARAYGMSWAPFFVYEREAATVATSSYLRIRRMLLK